MLKRPKPFVLPILDGFGYPVERECHAMTVQRRIFDALRTSDHDRIGQMPDKETGRPYTARATHQVSPVHVCGDRPLVSGASLSGFASTMPEISGVDQSVEMTGTSLHAPV
ncbi:hypothetical protein [Methylosarcina fibrata]|uniref:hypothetical protein n=1 Tax=Methylosarcina fibrata TaxID=105972 RepID=UPI00035EFDE6|nr:hypothetical protein [Methylosarcina fibrata]